MLRKTCYGSHRPVAERLPVSRQVVASILAGGNRLRLRLRIPLICAFLSFGLRQAIGTPGVGTFPEWLSLAVAPASKGLSLSRSR
jgi:hypothetical protein